MFAISRGLVESGPDLGFAMVLGYVWVPARFISYGLKLNIHIVSCFLFEGSAARRVAGLT